MVTLRNIRKRLRSVTNIEQITKAMEMVAAARLKKAQKNAEHSRPFAVKIKQTLENLALSGVKHPVFEKRKLNHIGLVIVTGDRGLCGAYNNTILSAADRFLKSYQSEQVKLILIGKKGVEYYSQKTWPILIKMTDWGGKISFDQIKKLSSDLFTFYCQGQLDEIWLAYTDYINILSRKVIIEKFMNIENSDSNKGLKLDYIFEPNAKAVFDELLLRYSFSKILSILNESYASELSARMIAMKAATKNAEEMIEKLTLIRNKVRQAGITREMIEITSGAEYR